MLRWITTFISLNATAFACPLCNSATGETVRAGIFNASFSPTLLQVLMPFPIICLGIYTAVRFLTR